MKLIIRKLPFALKVHRLFKCCAFCETGSWFVKRPELVYCGRHRYPRWQCDTCGRTPQRLRAYAALKSATLAAQAAGPGTEAWRVYEKLNAYESETVDGT